MNYNYIRLAFRRLRKQPFFSVINIAGLATGLAACWLIALFVFHEKSFDRFLPDADRICAVALDLKMGDQEGRTTNTPPPVGPRLVADFQEVELTARTFSLGDVVVRRDWPGHAPLIFNENTAMAADTALLELFGFPMAEGNIRSALDRPGSQLPTGWRCMQRASRSAWPGRASASALAGAWHPPRMAVHEPAGDGDVPAGAELDRSRTRSRTKQEHFAERCG